MYNNYLFVFLQGGQEGLGGILPSILLMVAIFAVFYFLLIRPQQKKQKELQKKIEAIQRGDRILTSGGMYATVVGIKDNIVVAKISDEVKVEFAKASISAIVAKE